MGKQVTASVEVVVVAEHEGIKQRYIAKRAIDLFPWGIELGAEECLKDAVERELKVWMNEHSEGMAVEFKPA